MATEDFARKALEEEFPEVAKGNFDVTPSKEQATRILDRMAELEKGSDVQLVEYSPDEVTPLSELREYSVDEVTPIESPKKDRGRLEAAGRAVATGITAGFMDELTGVVGATIDQVATLWDGSDSPKEFWKSYRKYRDVARARQEAAGEQYPVTTTAGEIGGAALATVGTAGVGAATTIPRLMASGAAVGGLTAAGTSEAELVPERSLTGLVTGETAAPKYGEFAQDVGMGAVVGAGLGTALPLAGRTLQAGAQRLARTKLGGVLDLWKLGGKRQDTISQEISADDLDWIMRRAREEANNLKVPFSGGGMDTIAESLTTKAGKALGKIREEIGDIEVGPVVNKIAKHEIVQNIQNVSPNLSKAALNILTKLNDDLKAATRIVNGEAVISAKDLHTITRGINKYVFRGGKEMSSADTIRSSFAKSVGKLLSDTEKNLVENHLYTSYQGETLRGYGKAFYNEYRWASAFERLVDAIGKRNIPGEALERTVIRPGVGALMSTAAAIGGAITYGIPGALAAPALLGVTRGAIKRSGPLVRNAPKYTAALKRAGEKYGGRGAALIHGLLMRDDPDYASQFE